MNLKRISNYSKDLYFRLQQDSQVFNSQTLKGVSHIDYFSGILYFFLRFIIYLNQQQYVNAIVSSSGIVFYCAKIFYKNDNKKLSILLPIGFWIASIKMITSLFLNQRQDEKIFDIQVYDLMIGPLSLFCSLKYQIIHKIILHIQVSNIDFVKYDNTIDQVLNIVAFILMIIINISFCTFKIVHTEKEFEKKRNYEEIIFTLPEYTFKFVKNSKNQISILESNRQQTYQQFVDYYTEKNLGIINQIFIIFIKLLKQQEYDEILPFSAVSLFDVIFKLILEENGEKQEFKINAISNRDKPNQKKFKILIMKQQQNFENIVFLRITELDIEEQMELIKTRELMFNSINHDIKNPLIAGDLLIKDLLTQSMNQEKINHEDLESLSYYFNLCLCLINGYFDFTLAQIGVLKLQLEKFNLYEPFTKTIDIMKHIALKKHVNLKSLFKVKKIYGKNDVRRISQVLMNLIDNAIKFTLNNGNVTVQYEEFFYYNLIYITIIDTGIGMSPEILGKIGKPYATFNNKNMNSYGTGIGLFTSQKTVGLIGPLEKIFISSEEGQGSQFSFFIYLNAQDTTIKPKIEQFNNDIQKILLFLRKDEIIDYKLESENNICIPEEFFLKKNIREGVSSSMMKTNIGQKQIIKQKKLKIMVIDDEEIIRKATLKAIMKLGQDNFQFLEAQDGLVGLELFKINNHKNSQSSIDLIITDIVMPEMDGIQMTQEINNLIKNQEYRQPDIIALSSNYSNEFSIQCKSLNINQNFSKPQTAEQIRSIIKKYQYEKTKEQKLLFAQF